VLKNIFNIHIPFFDKYFYCKNKELKLGFGNRVTVLNNFFYRYEGVYNKSLCFFSVYLFKFSLTVYIGVAGGIARVH